MSQASSTKSRAFKGAYGSGQDLICERSERFDQAVVAISCHCIAMACRAAYIVVGQSSSVEADAGLDPALGNVSCYSTILGRCLFGHAGVGGSIGCPYIT